jgi:hypothetical protein
MEFDSYHVYVAFYLLPAIFLFHGMKSNMIFQVEMKHSMLNWKV